MSPDDLRPPVGIGVARARPILRVDGEARRFVFLLGQAHALDRLDDALEPLARYLGGKMQWDEMKENAMMATTDTTSGGAYLLAQKLADLVGVSAA